ncbi:CRE-CYN-17 protein [Caenorhabditis remanei]|uniref:CRE-CYN-17 protein n=1 Tax=Caenorhabditis remanei TaxID=31234 RepID=E3LUG0_CAERE|nr:CRE-CYN-17 protein [Caenorhabditis remanei]
MRLAAQLILLTIAAYTANAGQASRQAAVNKAIEQTKSRLTPAASPLRVPPRANSSPGKTENLDVDRLNRLIRALDKTWIMPKAGAKEPVGSNFQYKKTCASIYKARHGACQQLGFGVMCFNYCHERGEKLAFKCQDTSDTSYCKQSGTFDTFLAKYRKDGYKAKAYIHQMISRCYATTVCNTQTGILNSTIIDEDPEPVEKTTKANRLKLLTRKPGNALSLMKLKTKTTTTTQAPEEVPEVEETPEEEEEHTTTTRKTRPVKKVVNNTLRQKPTPAPEVTTTKANIWDKFTIGNKAKPTPKYIPFWQRLMSTTSKPIEDEATEETELNTDAPEEVVEEASTQAEVLEKEVEETTPEESETTSIPEEDLVETKSKVHKTNAESSTDAPKHTFKPIPVTVPSTGPELSHQKPNEDVSGPGFWNRFQPNRWFDSIHYVTNTGK